MVGSRQLRTYYHTQVDLVAYVCIYIIHTYRVSTYVYIVGVEASSCTEGLKVLLDYKQRQYAEGKVLRWCVCVEEN